MGARFDGLNTLNPDSVARTGNPPDGTFDFGTPQSLSIDTLMQDPDTADILNYRSASMTVPHGYDTANLLTQAPIATGHLVHDPSLPSFAGQRSPGMERDHRLSFSSMAGSDNTSPDVLVGSGGFADTSHDLAALRSRGADGDHRNDDGQADDPPPWSELKTKAGKERKRLPLACTACRRKKIRCSGEKPACKHCLRSRIPCVYKVTTKKAAPRTDYMAMLDKRLKRMEERVIKVIPKDEQDIVATTGRAIVKPPLPPPPPKPAGSKKRAADTAFDEELDDWANSNAEVIQSEGTGARDSRKEPLVVQDSDEQNMLQEGAENLPSAELQQHLSEVFFDCVYCQSYPLLHKPSFMRKLDQGQVPPVLMLAVCAISARFSNHPEVRSESGFSRDEQPGFLRGELWAAPAREIALRRYDTPNITILIVYLILGLHEFGTCQGGRSWMFGGMAQRMAYALQLHKDLDHNPTAGRGAEKSRLTFTDREIRRRTMWACFLMDRFNSSGTERPIFIGEQYIRAQLPIKESYFQMEIPGPTEDLDGNIPNPVDEDTGQVTNAKDNMGVCAYLIRLVAIWGRLINYMNLGGKDLDALSMWEEKSTFGLIKEAVKSWRESLHESLTYTPENLENHASEKIANQFIFMHLVYYQIILFMNRFALPTPEARSQCPKNMPQEFRAEAARIALDAANQISALVNDAMDYTVVVPFSGYCAFFSSTVHISGAFSKNAALEAASKQNLAYNVKFLTKLKKYWGMFHFVTENLRDLYRRHADAARSGSNPGNKENGEQGIFQYGDWFDRYPHGVSGTDYEEPSAEVKKEPGADAVLGQKSDLQSVEEFFSKLTPPSRAVQRERQQPTSRKVAKRRSAKSESKQARPDQNGNATVSVAGQNEFDVQNTAAGMPGFAQPSTGFTPDLQQTQNAALVGSSLPLMSQMDRQMVLDSYAGVNAMPMLDPATSLNWDGFDFTALASGNSNIFTDNSAAWFMPFNMEPPAGGEDNFFGGGVDWGSMANLAVDLQSGLQPTGFTPRGLEVDTMQDNPLDSGGQMNLDGLQDMQ